MGSKLQIKCRGLFTAAKEWKSERLAEQQSASGDPDPCLEEQNAVDAAAYDLDQAVAAMENAAQALMDRTEALLQCRMQNSQ